MTFNLWELRHHFEFLDNGPIVCPYHEYDLGHQYTVDILPSRIATSKSRLRLFEISSKEAVSSHRMRAALQNLSEPICPHMHTYDPALFRRLMRHTKSPLPMGMYCGRKEMGTVSVECKNPDCDTVLSTKRKSGYVEIKITRRLGFLRSVQDKR